MPDDFKTTDWDDNSDSRALDPLGVIGWVIGGKYKIRSYLGGGGFGEVYDGYNVNLIEQRLVIKFFKKVQARDKFDKEAKILCLLDHPNINRVIDYLPEEGALVVAFIDGKDGKEFLRESGPLPDELLLKVARTMTSALAYAHEKKIAHRDIKPDNILIDHNEHVYLIDFGIAKVMREDATKTAYQALTPMFAAPERQGGDANYNPFLSDIYETGVTLFNFATNEMPYRNPANPDISEWGGPKAKRLSPQIRHILKKATHPDPSKRYKTIAEMGRELKAVQQVYGGKTQKPILTIAAILIILAAGAFFTRDYWLPMAQNIIESSARSDSSVESESPPGTTGENLSAEEQAADMQERTAAEEGAPTSPGESSENITTPEENNAGAEIASPTDGGPGPGQEAGEEPASTEAGESVQEPEEQLPPPLPTLIISVIPDYNVTVLVDGTEKSPNKKFDINKGIHEVTIIQPDFPILTDQVQTNVDRSLRYNLQDEFFLSDTVTFRIGALPSELGNAVLEASFNGYGNKYTADNLPILDLRKISGKWQVKFDFLTAQGARYPGARVDSIVTFPYGGGPRIHVRGGQSTMDFDSSKWPGLESIDMLVYWSKN